MRRSLRINLVVAGIVAFFAIIPFFLVESAPTLIVAAKPPVTRVEFANPSRIAVNFYYFTEVYTNGQWKEATRQPEGAYGASHAEAYSKHLVDIAPPPADTNVWRVCVGYQRAGPELPMHLKLAEKLGVFKTARDKYWAHTTVYAEVRP